MKKVFIIHGFQGWPNLGWKSWLMGELAKEGIWACSLPMPSANNPKNEEWIKMITNCVGNINKDVILVGHSLGVPAILNYLQKIDTQIGGAVLVSGPYKLNTPSLILKSVFIGSFFKKEFDWQLIKKNCKKFQIIHAKDDTLVPLDHASILAKNLGGKLDILEKGGHLSDDCFELPEVLDALKKML